MHAQPKRWVEVGEHPSLRAESTWLSISSTCLAEVASIDLKFKCAEYCEKACIIS